MKAIKQKCPACGEEKLFRQDQKTCGCTRGRTLEKSTPNLSDKVKKLLLGKVMTVSELSDALGCSPKAARKIVNELLAAGHNVQLSEDKVTIDKTLEPGNRLVVDSKDFFNGKTYIFGVCGDTHLYSKYARMDVLNAVYDIYEREGITKVFNPGNAIDGEARFNKFDLIGRPGMGPQLDYFAAEFPQRKGIETFFITGDDHEGWYINREGVNIGQMMEDAAVHVGRKDLKWIGHMEADVVFKSKRGQAVVKIMHPGGGCFDDKAEILTKEKGWIPFSDLTFNDEVATMTQTGHVFEWQYPSHITNQPYSGDMIHFKNRVFDFSVTPDHRLWIRRNRSFNASKVDKKFLQKGHQLKRTDWHALTAQNIYEEYYRQCFSLPTVCDDWKGTFIPFINVPRLEPMHPNNKRNVEQMQHIGEVPMKLMAELLAWYVTEGSSTKKGFTISQSKKANPDKYADIEELLANIGVRFTSGKKDIHVGSKELSSYLETQCGKGAYHKYLPIWLKNQPKEILLVVLNTMIRGDGWKNGDSFGYKSYSPKLRSDISEIAQKCGYGVTFDENAQAVNIRVIQNTPTLNNKPIIEQYSGNIYCCTVPNSLIYVRVNGKAFWSHNSAYAISYTDQKTIESLQGGEKPNMLISGHYHKFNFSYIRDVYALQSACVQDQTPFMRKLKLQAHIGASIVRMHQADTGEINRVNVEFFPFYDKKFYEKNDKYRRW